MIGSAYGVWRRGSTRRRRATIYGAPDAIVAGALRPTGKARTSTAASSADGRWSFASGIQPQHLVGRPAASSLTATRQDAAVFHRRAAADGELIDTWTTGGMRGTGSHDYAIKDLFIPAERIIAGRRTGAPARPALPLPADGPDGQR